jgi:hypothetical protein
VKHILIIILALFFGLHLCNAQNLSLAILAGKVVDERNVAVPNATVSAYDFNIGAATDDDGKFELKIPAGQFVKITVTHSAHRNKIFTYKLAKDERKNIIIALEKSRKDLGAVVAKARNSRNNPGMVVIDPKKADILPSTIGGIEGLLKIFLSGNNNELTSQYNVRGGNFDENLVYINDFEVYRPFLARSGQQEGLSIINSDMVQSVQFSTGGFQAKYGDKMSSVLDVQYKKPKEFGAGFTASLLQASAYAEGISRNNRFTYLVGLRQKSNSYLLGAQQTTGTYLPSFTDAQAMFHYDLADKWDVDILANYARNRFNFWPASLEATFGTVTQVYRLRIQYQGKEIDQFDSRFGGISFTNTPNTKTHLKFLASGFQTNEIETYDLQGEYLLGQVESDLGSESFNQIKASLGTGVIHNYARNYLRINTANIGHKGTYDGNKHFVQWGVNYNPLFIDDRLNEWERRDSAGYNQPNNDDSIVMFNRYNTTNILQNNIFNVFAQDNMAWDNLGLTLSYGIRGTYNALNNELLVSPRVTTNWKPRNWKRNAVIRAATGLYQQPPFYRELRNLQGEVNPAIRAQKSAHVVLGTDINFVAWNRPFRFTLESYYKYLWDLVPYEWNNIRIRYYGQNNSKGYALGTEARLYGDIVKDAESWVSLGVMSTAEDLKGDKGLAQNASTGIIDTVDVGYIPRPTDSRFTLGLFFQDYFRNNKNIKVHLNAMYGAGLPYGLPDGQKYNDVRRLPAYRRVDIGFSALLVDNNKNTRPYYSVWHKLKSMWLSVEVFNLLDIRNTISYTYVQDLSTARTYAAPNQLTNRLLNVKINVKL